MNSLYYSSLLTQYVCTEDPILASFKALPKHQPRETDFRIKYKTEICRNWEIGACEFAESCAFAHGYEELRNKCNLGSNYKTKKCKQFHEQGYCIYGNRCQFKHRDQSIDTAPNSPKSHHASCRNSSRDSTKRRLQIFIDIEKRESDSLII